MQEKPVTDTRPATDILNTMARVFELLEPGRHDTGALQKEHRALLDSPLDATLKTRLSGMLAQAVAISERLDGYHQHEFSLRAVFESAQALTELKTLNTVLFEITERGRRLLGSDLAWVAGVDAGDGSLRALAYSGVFSRGFSDWQTPISGGVAGHILNTRSSFTTHDYLNDVRFQHTESSDSMIQGEGLISLVAVPLLSGSEVIGVLLVGDRYTRHYQPREINILTALAAHASVAVRNARAFEMTCKALEEAERANDRLLQQTNALEFAADAHERMTRMLAKGTHIPEVVATVVHLLGGTLYYLDAVGNILCAHGADGPVAETGLDALADRADIVTAQGQSRVSGQAVALKPKNSPGSLRLAAVLSGDELHGALLIHTRQALTESAVRVLERSTLILAVLELSVEKKSSSLDREIDLLVRSLIDGRSSPESGALFRLEDYGCPAGHALSMAFIQTDKGTLGFLLRRLRARFRPLTTLITALDDGVLVIYPHEPAMEEDLEKFLFEELDIEGLACLSGPHAEPRALHEAYADIRKVSALAQRLGRRNRIVHEAELRMYAVLFQEQSRHDMLTMVSRVIGPLIESDRKRQGQLCATLLAYLNSMQNARSTARHLGVHVNTLHNRLETIGGLLGGWNERVAEVHIALQLHELLQGP